MNHFELNQVFQHLAQAVKSTFKTSRNSFQLVNAFHVIAKSIINEPEHLKLSDCLLRSLLVCSEAVRRQQASEQLLHDGVWFSSAQWEKHAVHNMYKNNLLVVNVYWSVRTCGGRGFALCRLVIGLLSCRVWRGRLVLAELLQEEPTGQRQSGCFRFLFFSTIRDTDRILSNHREQQKAALSCRISGSDSHEEVE